MMLLDLYCPTSPYFILCSSLLACAHPSSPYVLLPFVLRSSFLFMPLVSPYLFTLYFTLRLLSLLPSLPCPSRSFSPHLLFHVSPPLPPTSLSSNAYLTASLTPPCVTTRRQPSLLLLPPSPFLPNPSLRLFFAQPVLAVSSPRPSATDPAQ